MSAKILQRVDVNLRSFYIFNSSFGKKEGDEYKKVLYYYPGDIELNTKIKDVGLSEAIITFSGSFTSDDSDCNGLHTQKTTQLFYQPEPGFWMVLVLNVPKEVRSKDGVEVTDYKGGEVHDVLYRAVLEQCYNMFRLFNGTFQMNMKLPIDKQEQQLQGEQNLEQITDTARQQLQLQLELFYEKHLPTIKFSMCDILDIMRSIQYMPLDKFLFLRAHNFIKMLRATFANIKETILLFNEQVVCSDKVHPIDLYTLHEYLLNVLLAQTTQPSDGTNNGTTLMRSNSTAAEIYRNGAYITGPIKDNENVSEPPKIYLQITNEDGTLTFEAFHLVIYRAMSVILCLFVPVDELLHSEFYKDLHEYAGPQLISLSRDIVSKQATTTTTSTGNQMNATGGTTITTSCSSDSVDSSAPKFIFINEQSLKHLTNISFDRHMRRNSKLPIIPTTIVNLIADLRNDFNADVQTNTLSPKFEEVQVKTTNDFWIVKRRVNWRQYYVIIFNSKATLLDVTQEAKRIFEQELTDDVFFDK